MSIKNRLSHKNVHQQKEFTKNDDGKTLGATGKYVGVDMHPGLKEKLNHEAASYAQWVLDYESCSLDEKRDIILNSCSAQRSGFVFRLVEKKEDDNEENCVICLKEYEVNDEIHLLDCNHNYHTRCLKRWLVKKKNDTCPMCRTPVSSKQRCMYGI